MLSQTPSTTYCLLGSAGEPSNLFRKQPKVAAVFYIGHLVVRHSHLCHWRGRPSSTAVTTIAEMFVSIESSVVGIGCWWNVELDIVGAGFTAQQRLYLDVSRSTGRFHRCARLQWPGWLLQLPCREFVHQWLWKHWIPQVEAVHKKILSEPRPIICY